MERYAFVIDAKDKPLSPTKEVKAWYMVRKKKAELVRLDPMVIKLKREVQDNNKFIVGLDDGAKHVGIAVVQKGATKNKVLFKFQLDLRQEESDLITERRQFRKLRRAEKRYRPARFNNRTKSKPKGWVAPSIKHRKDTILKVVNLIKKYLNIDTIVLEEVKIDIRMLLEDDKTVNIDYTKPVKRSESVRKATIIRDNNTCMLCGEKKGKKECHHIRPISKGGSDTIKNTITLCPSCHKKVTGKELDYAEELYALIDGKDIDFRTPSVVHQGKTYLKEHLKKCAKHFECITGEVTAMRRREWKIDKTHSNDAVCITGLKPDATDVYEWRIKQFRRKHKKSKYKELQNIRNRDIVEYTYKKYGTQRGYVIALYPTYLKGAIRFISKTERTITDKNGKVKNITNVCDKINVNKVKKIKNGRGLCFY